MANILRMLKSYLYGARNQFIYRRLKNICRKIKKMYLCVPFENKRRKKIVFINQKNEKYNVKKLRNRFHYDSRFV